MESRQCGAGDAMARSGHQQAQRIDDEDLSALTAIVYSTVEHPDQWPNVLARISAAINAKSGLVRTLQRRNDQPAVVASHHYGLEDGLQATYCEGLVADDPYLDALERLPPGRIVTNDGLIDLERVRKTRFYRDYMLPLDNHFVIGGFIERQSEGYRTIVGFHRHAGGQQFDRKEHRLVQWLAPHLKQAMHLQRVLGHERRRADTAEDALDAMGVASVVLDGRARIVHANRSGEWLLREGRVLRMRNGQLIAGDPRHTATVRTLVDHALADPRHRGAPAPKSVLVPAIEAGASNVLVVAMPIEHPADGMREAWPEARAVLYVGDLDETGVLCPEILQALYGLTAAEARLAVAVGRGWELSSLADARGVSTETVRSQLKAVFAKTGVNRQIDLVRLLAGAHWKLAASGE